MLRILSLLFLSTLPITAQDAPRQEAENLFYRAFFLERGQRDYAQAVKLYEQFLAAAPEHKFANRAARSTYALLTRLERVEDASAFAEKHAAVLAIPATRVSKAEKSEAEKSEEEKSQAEEPAAERPAGRRGRGGRRGARGGRRGGRGGAFGILQGEQKLAEMDDEQISEFRRSLEQLAGFTDRMRQGGREEQAELLEGAIKKINNALDAGKTAEAQQALDELRESFRRR